MTQAENATKPGSPVEDPQAQWQELKMRVAQLEAERGALQEEIEKLRQLVERAIEHRLRSHGELVLLLTTLVSKLPLTDVGVIVAKLVDHNTNVSDFLTALVKGTAPVHLDQPAVLQALEQTKRELRSEIKAAVEELLRLEAPIERQVLEGIGEDPERFFSPAMVRVNRCFIKGQVPRERVLREFGQDALIFFNDLTTDPKLNPRPKTDEIVLGFKNEFAALFQEKADLLPQKRQDLLALHQKVQQSKAPGEQGRGQKIAFQKLSFLVELLHFYEHQATEAPDVLFAQRLPSLVEQIVFSGAQDALDEKLIVLAESLIGRVIHHDHRQAVINNVGKSGVAGRTLRFVLKLRGDKLPDMDLVIAEFIKHLVPSPPQKAEPAAVATALRLVKPEMQRHVLKALLRHERLRRQEAEALAKTVGEKLGIKDLQEQLKAAEAMPVETERQLAWGKIKDLILHRTSPTAVATAIRDRLNAKYDADEIRQSWVTLTEADPLSLIKIFCQLPYLANGKTDSISRTVLESYVTRLTHPKYAATYHKVLNSLKTMHHARPDSPTLVNFIALVKWVDPEAANRVCADIGMTVSA